jgi:hypothetical protein
VALTLQFAESSVTFNGNAYESPYRWALTVASRVLVVSVAVASDVLNDHQFTIQTQVYMQHTISLIIIHSASIISVGLLGLATHYCCGDVPRSHVPHFTFVTQAATSRATVLHTKYYMLLVTKHYFLSIWPSCTRSMLQLGQNLGLGHT